MKNISFGLENYIAKFDQNYILVWSEKSKIVRLFFRDGPKIYGLNAGAQ